MRYIARAIRDSNAASRSRFSPPNPVTHGDLWIVPLNGDKPREFVATRASEDEPAFSPDGQWIAFNSTRSGTEEVYARHINGGRMIQMSTGGGRDPLWNRDGTELFYAAADRTLMTVAVRRAGNSLEAAAPRPLFTRHGAGPRGGGSFCVSPGD